MSFCKHGRDMNATIYNDFQSVPEKLKTKGFWAEQFRIPKDGAVAIAYVRIQNSGRVKEKSDTSDSSTKEGEIPQSDINKEYQIVTIPLFHEDQTVQYIPSCFEVAEKEYRQIYYKYSNKDKHITLIKTKNDVEPTWITKTYENYFYYLKLTKKKIKSHYFQNTPIGVLGRKYTRFILIDLDLHNGCPFVFMKYFKILMKIFYGTSTWHIGFNPEKVNGLHFIRVFSEPVLLSKETEKIRNELIGLAKKHPELEKEALKNGNVGFEKMEIYPNNNKGVRLPLGKLRTVIIDKVLGFVQQKLTKRTKIIPDLVGYTDWIKNPEKKWMSDEDLVKRVEAAVNFKQVPAKIVIETNTKTYKLKNTNKQKISKGNSSKSMKGNSLKFLIDYWINGISNGFNLNTFVWFTLKLCRYSNKYDKKQTFSGILMLIGELPDYAKNACSRIVNNQLTKLEGDLKRLIDYVFDNEDEVGKKICQRFLSVHKGFDPLKKDTWQAALKFKIGISPIFTKEEKARIYKYLEPALNLKTNKYKTVFRFVKEIIKLVIFKYYEFLESKGQIVQGKKYTKGGFHKAYLKIWIKFNFPEIKLGKSEKQQKVIDLLQDLGIMKVRNGCKGNIQKGCTKWDLGLTAIKSIGCIESWVL